MGEKRGRRRAFWVKRYHKQGLVDRNEQGSLWDLYGPFWMKWSMSCWDIDMDIWADMKEPDLWKILNTSLGTSDFTFRGWVIMEF